MAKYSYSTVPSKLTELLQKIQEVGIPHSANLDWLKSIGFTGSNDRTLLTVLKFVGFADSSGRPTEEWTRYRSKGDGGKVLAQMLLDSYSPLFQLYGDAYSRSEEELVDYFTAETSSGAQTVNKTVATFKTLCALADFSDSIAKVDSQEDSPPSGPVQRAAPDSSSVPNKGSTIVAPEIGGGVTINLNIQLTLPAEMDREGYGEFFAALRKHLIEPYSENEE